MALFGLSNTRAITTISDSVHHAIDINIFEREFIDSSYFQRLHFILQNSTAFVSFPSNKNTRFPHSLGVAAVAGEIFSRSLSNASATDLRILLPKMANFLLQLCEKLEGATQRDGAFEEPPSSMEDALRRCDEAHTDTISGLSGFLHNPLHSTSGSQSIPDEEDDTRGRVTFHERFGPFSVRFIVDTYWQAVRLYALMHDIGHLPMSHSFEAALESQAQLYTVRENEEASGEKFDVSVRLAYEEYERLLTERRNEYKFDADHYLSFFQDLLDIPSAEIEAATFHKAFHEVRGISIFNRHARKPGPGFPEEIIPYRRLVNHLCLAMIYSNALAPENTGKDTPHEHAFLYT
ncbi:hypothetical protein, partial [Neorhizobium galegae]|uniref:hypothetical protein n=1 Tax=Neorhizobium galegae TaxID=399 RepID=UPI0006218651